MPEPHERLDTAMNARRLELRMNWRDLAQAAEVSYEALRAIRKGDYRPTELRARALDEALQWVPGSVYAVLDGGEPVTLAMQQAMEQVASRETEPGDVAPTPDQELELAVRLMAAQVRELGLTPEEAEEAWRRARLRIEQSREPESHPDNPRRHRAG